MKTAYILIGPSGAGKSTTVEQLKVEHAGQSVGVFSLDTCRLAFYAWHGFENGVLVGRPQLKYMQLNLPTEREEMVKFYSDAFTFCNEAGGDFDAFVTETWLDVRNNNDVVIVDNTNVTRKSRARWVNDLRAVRDQSFHIVMVEFQVPLQTIVVRQATRPDKSIPINAINQQYFRQEAALLGSECDEVRVVQGEVVGDGTHMATALISLNRYLNAQSAKHAEVTGDFACIEQRVQYANKLAARMNAMPGTRPTNWRAK